MIPSIAVVEDGESTRRFLCEVLTQEGYFVRGYGTRTEAANALFKVPPDLLVVDVDLPDGSGLDLIAQLGTPQTRPPAIVVSGGETEDEIVQAYARGAADYLVKPFREADLLARCRLHLGLIAGEPRNEGALLFGRYVVIRELGRGGFGTVYLARDPRNPRERVALKVPQNVPDDPRARARFCREAGVLATIRHPNVVAIRDFGMVGEHLFCAMEYVDGEMLFDRIRRAGPLDETATREVALGLLRALVATERADVVHRDVKPANVVLRGGKTADPVLIDFGVARWRTDHGLTDKNIFLGTIGYAAPEVWIGRDPDARSDLFSLGMTLRFALAASEPFPHLQGADLLEAFEKEAVPLPDAPLTPGFASLLSSLVAKSPGDRPPTAREALARLESLPQAPPSMPRGAGTWAAHAGGPAARTDKVDAAEFRRLWGRGTTT